MQISLIDHEVAPLISSEVSAYAAPLMMVGGKWRAGTAQTTTAVVNPATGMILDRLSHASVKDLNDALNAADQSIHKWSRTLPPRRAQVLIEAARLMRGRSSKIARLLTLEQGKPLVQSEAEVAVAADMVQWYGEQARRIEGRLTPSPLENGELSVRHEPVGPCALFSPWNMPVLLAARKIGGALAAGCSAILKPAEETPAAIAEVVQCFADAGVPEGVLNLVFGVPPEIASHLLSSRVIRKVSLTGSVGAGRDIARLASANFVRTTLELGGYAPVLILEDADIERAVPLLIAAKFRNAGQLCLAPTRFLIHETVYDRFTHMFVEQTSKLRIGDGLTDVDMGPLANERRLRAIVSLIEDAVEDGANVLVGGRKVDGPGFFYLPTVLADVPGTSRIRTEEPFGPVAIMDRFSDLNSAIAEANGTDYGLAAYAFTDSIAAQKLIVDRLKVGVLAFNNITLSMAEAPFGGVKDSGYGRESGQEGLSEYLTVKTVHTF